MTKKLVAIVPDGKRMNFARKALRENGIEAKSPENAEYGEGDVLLLPVPSGRFLNDDPEKLGDYIKKLKKNATVFGTAWNGSDRELIGMGFSTADYDLSPNFSSVNTIATAEGALSIIISNTEYNITGKRLLITGWGKLAKEMSRLLHLLGGDIYICARRESAKEEARALGYTSFDVSDIYDFIGKCSVIVNTVPSNIISGSEIIKHGTNIKNKLFLELASRPYGYLSYELEALGARCILGAALPEKYSPGSSGEAMAEAVISHIQKGKNE